MLIWLMRIGGVGMSIAIFAVFLGTETMAAIHGRLGLGGFPTGTLTDYLTRTVSALYAFHGVLILALSTDVRRYRPVIGVVAWANVAFGALLTGVHLHAGLPSWWTWTEGPWVVGIGLVMLWLLRAVPRRVR